MVDFHGNGHRLLARGAFAPASRRFAILAGLIIGKPVAVIVAS
ncbi:MAG: hypothetical protein K0R44_217 [Thermomicrobiales bacterium]|jgi:hypothetical protein|nr:hypothetical protein [Thermomicrobiales bacterium]